jgi:hypothetical protein
MAEIHITAVCKYRGSLGSLNAAEITLALKLIETGLTIG